MYKRALIVITIGVLLMSRTARSETPNLEDLPLQDSIECFGITWTFSQPVRVGQFVNGDYYVVGPCTVTALDPAPTPERNGSVLNVPLQSGRSGFDSRTSSGRFTESWRADPPVAMKPGDCLMSSISINARGDFEPWLREGNETPSSYVKSVSALTCLDAPVSTDAFRPSYCDRGQKIYLASDLKRDLLPGLPKVSGTPDIDTWAWHYRRPWNEVCFFGFDAAVEYQACYGRENGRAAGLATLLLCSDFTPAEKESLLINFVQHGIDLWGMVRSGFGGWPAHGGHGSGRKWPIMFAGLMLGDTAMAAPSRSYPNCKFGEDMQTMHDTCWTGATAVYAGHQGVWNGQPVSSIATWGPYEHLHPRDWIDSYPGESYRRCCTSIAWVGQALSALILGAKGNWDHDAFFDYCDRWMTEDDTEHIKIILAETGANFGAGYQRQRRVWDSMVNGMWAAHRDSLGQSIKDIVTQAPGSEFRDILVRPNPFKDRIAISFSLPVTTRVTVTVFNLKGEVIDTVTSKELPAGENRVEWNGTSLENGKYLLHITDGNYLETREIIKVQE